MPIPQWVVRACRKSKKRLVCKGSRGHIEQPEKHNFLTSAAPIPATHPPAVKKKRILFLSAPTRGNYFLRQPNLVCTAASAAAKTPAFLTNSFYPDFNADKPHPGSFQTTRLHADGSTRVARRNYLCANGSVQVALRRRLCASSSSVQARFAQMVLWN